jgi:enoyl-CoA hydratase/carnithine racemase
MAMTEELVTYELDGTIAVIGLNRAHKRNSISDDVIPQLRAAVGRAGDEARAGVIFGHGDNFSAGLDLREAAERMKSGNAKRRPRGYWHPTFDMIARGPIPFVAALRGACIGGGLELASATHVRVADETTYFALPEGQRGIFVGGGGSVRIQRLLGYARMADLMLTGRILTAAEGERVNLCQYVVPSGEALEKAKALARRIAENTPQSNFAITNGLPRIADLSHDDGLFFESMLAASTHSPQSMERLQAFVEKTAKPLAIPSKTTDAS